MSCVTSRKGKVTLCLEQPGPSEARRAVRKDACFWVFLLVFWGLAFVKLSCYRH